ncbi:hypothetical protein DFJ58DRAFT_809268, partial [Suillus subalutaceus]|uniref:uncharacterized protein n=1 Tax=Suillus subalutaceus TaxID=48586 RepID=UPI001B85C668
ARRSCRACAAMGILLPVIRRRRWRRRIDILWMALPRWGCTTAGLGAAILNLRSTGKAGEDALLTIDWRRALIFTPLLLRRHVTQNSVARPAGNGHQAQHCGSQHYTTHRGALQQPAPQITIPFTPTLSCTLVNALRPDIRGVSLYRSRICGRGILYTIISLHLTRSTPLPRCYRLTAQYSGWRTVDDDTLGATQTSVYSTYNKTL